VGDLRLDLFTKVAWRGERRIDLALLELFMRHPTHVLSRTRILNEVWEYGFDPDNNIVDVYVSYLRKKINFRRPRTTDPDGARRGLPSRAALTYWPFVSKDQ
jgi:DNA-binding response OmpR family regulator